MPAVIVVEKPILSDLDLKVKLVLMVNKKTSFRTEHDALGSVNVPKGAYHGSFTTRALANFQISGFTAPTLFRHALGMVKLAAVQANRNLKQLPSKEAKAMEQAAREFMEGRFDDEFGLDVFQAGAGTPFNMNANEIIANRANELLKAPKGSYKYVHPNNHVNMAQSSNDVIPTATRLSMLMGFQFLKEELASLVTSFDAIAKRHSKLLKIGRTHLETAVPITVGQEFKAYAAALKTLLKTIQESEKSLTTLGIGGTAIGTGINTLPGFSKAMVSNLSALSGFTLSLAPNLVETTRSHSALLKASSALRAVAIELQTIANDVRLLSSSILNEINIPEAEPGSSIMPGKVNPSTPECLNMICCQVIGNDHAVALGAQNGQLQLNWHTPLIMWNLLQSTQILTYGIAMFREDCVDGIQVNESKISDDFDNSLVTATALAPTLGYYKVAELVNEASRTGQPLREVVESKNLIPKRALDRLLSPSQMVKPRKP